MLLMPMSQATCLTRHLFVSVCGQNFRPLKPKAKHHHFLGRNKRRSMVLFVQMEALAARGSIDVMFCPIITNEIRFVFNVVEMTAMVEVLLLSDVRRACICHDS